MTTITSSSAAAYGPSSTRTEVLADALGRIVTGRPLPDSLRPAVVAVQAPATAEEGIARMLAIT